MTIHSRLCIAAVLAVGIAANVLAERRPVEMNCKITGRFVACKALYADDMVELAWVYTTKPSYTSVGSLNSGPIQVKSSDCTAIVFYGTDPETWATHMASINIKLRGGVATFKECEQKNVKPE